MDDRKIQTLHLTDSGYFFALCNDGTFWKHVNLYNIGTGSESNYWERLTDIPQGDEQYPLLMRCAKSHPPKRHGRFLVSNTQHDRKLADYANGEWYESGESGRIRVKYPVVKWMEIPQ